MTTPNPTIRERYLADSVNTASPTKLLIMLYDRLVLDLTRAEQDLGAGDRTAAAPHLLHAQEIILELRTSLNIDVWEGAPRLASIYGFLITELVNANVTADAERVAACRALVEPLRDAWREAAAITAASAQAGAVVANPSLPGRVPAGPIAAG